MPSKKSVSGVRNRRTAVGGGVRGYEWQGEAQDSGAAKPSEGFDWFKEALKRETRILGQLQRRLVLSNEERNADRDTDHLHASEMAKKDWCPRSSWYKCTGAEGDKEKIRWQLANVFEEGHAIHDKYQTLIASIGVLEGAWQCRDCKHQWYATSPVDCPICPAFAPPKYMEVPLQDDELMLIGHADGIIDDDQGRALLELKSVGLGTVRIEAPGIYKTYNDKEMSLSQLWAEIRHPFSSHLRQVNLYMRATGLRQCVLIYEFKATQQVKEFVVGYQPRLIESIVESAKSIKYAIDNGKTVKRPEWAEEDHRTCKSCAYFKTCWKVGDEAPEERESISEPRGSGGSPVKLIRRRTDRSV